MIEVVSLALLVFCLLVYVWPLMEACHRNHPHVEAIAVANILLGWTIIGWVVCLAWALTTPEPQPRTS